MLRFFPPHLSEWRVRCVPKIMIGTRVTKGQSMVLMLSMNKSDVAQHGAEQNGAERDGVSQS